MAEDDKGQEKTEDPTPKRLEKAREEGQVPRSRELTTTLLLLCSTLGLMLFGAFLYERMAGMTALNFAFTREAAFDTQLMFKHLGWSLGNVLIGLLPFFAVLVLAAIIGPTALGGWLFSTKSLAPKLNRMNPVEGIKRMFSMKSLVELLKAIGKVLVIAPLAVVMLYVLQGEILGLAREHLNSAIGHAMSMAMWVAVGLSLATILIAVADVPFQIWENTKKLKMSLQDVKDEMKETEGKPEVKSKIRQLQQQFAQSRMMADIPDADVVITNPTHFSVVVKYKPNAMQTPIVVAKGSDQIAIKIREIAAKHDVEIVQSPVLSRAIFYTTQLGAEIPSELYVAVARVLAYVFQLKNFRKGRAERPVFPHSVPVPEEMVFD